MPEGTSRQQYAGMRDTAKTGHIRQRCLVPHQTLYLEQMLSYSHQYRPDVSARYILPRVFRTARRVAAVGKRAEALELAVLGLLHDAPMHGYELRKRVNALLGWGRAFS